MLELSSKRVVTESRGDELLLMTSPFGYPCSEALGCHYPRGKSIFVIEATDVAAHDGLWLRIALQAHDNLDKPPRPPLWNVVGAVLRDMDLRPELGPTRDADFEAEGGRLRIPCSSVSVAQGTACLGGY